MATKITFSLSDELRLKLEQKIKDTNFKTIQEYIAYVLEQMISEGNLNNKKKVTYSDKDEEALKKKLREMGYL